jgi:ubiquinone/menaquinone biosynthesis C-methylase UbiE
VEPVRDPEQNEPEYLGRIEKLSGARVIEIGCGNGRLTWRYVSLVDSVIGIDPETDALKEAIDSKPLEGSLRFGAVRALAERLPLKAESFDVALFSWSL